MSMTKFLSLRTSGVTALEQLDVIPMNPISPPSVIRLFCHPSHKSILVSRLFSFSPKTRHPKEKTNVKPVISTFNALNVNYVKV